MMLLLVCSKAPFATMKTFHLFFLLIPAVLASNFCELLLAGFSSFSLQASGGELFLLFSAI